VLYTSCSVNVRLLFTRQRDDTSKCRYCRPVSRACKHGL